MNTESKPESAASPPASIRWNVGLRLLLLGIAAILWVRWRDDWAFQKRNLITYEISAVTLIALLVWWTFLSRAPNRLRLGITYGLLGLALTGTALFRIRGMSGDMKPILEFRWVSSPRQQSLSTAPSLMKDPAGATGPRTNSASFPQFQGPDRNGILRGPRLETDWRAHPPKVLWRQRVGSGWSGFAISGPLAITQEQRGPQEAVVALDVMTGRQVWTCEYPARFTSTIAGEGPRATPTVTGDRVLAYGGNGILNCLDLHSGTRLWSHDVMAETNARTPEWGCASSPLVVDDRVIVHGGEGAGHSLCAHRIADGQRAWVGGTLNASYSSPVLVELVGIRQLLSFNDGSISGHNPTNGATLWNRPWGNGNMVVSTPVVIGSNRVLFSSGYGVGAELIELGAGDRGRLTPTTVWKSLRMKSKFSHLFPLNGFLYGLDDGIFACLDLKDGSQRWKAGRYGHGQGLLVGDLYLLMAESGDLVLLRPEPDALKELARFPVFDSKTWNPIALSQDLLLVRNDVEAACLRLSTAE